MADKKVSKTGKRLDSKGRILKDGETQRPDGRYQYAYISSVTGKREFLYSWKLEKNDSTPKGKRVDKSLREKVKDIQYKEYCRIVPKGGSMTVLQLVESYIATKNNVRKSTKKGYRTVVNWLKKDLFGNTRIDKVKMSDAKRWVVRLQAEEGKSYSSIDQIRGVVRPAFKYAIADGLIMNNPFDFELKECIINDSIKREAISARDERRFLEFVQNDDHFSKYYLGMLILFKTGLRISEFCGLTVRDVDMNRKTINITHQYDMEVEESIAPTKTDASVREIPMSNAVYNAFEKVLLEREKLIAELKTSKNNDFVFLDEYGKPTPSYYWQKKFKYAVEKHNKIYKDELPKITPHVCRHTYITRLAVSGVNVKTLSRMVGHSSIRTTLDIYTTITLEDMEKAIETYEKNKSVIEEKTRGEKANNIIYFNSLA